MGGGCAGVAILEGSWDGRGGCRGWRGAGWGGAAEVAEDIIEHIVALLLHRQEEGLHKIALRLALSRHGDISGCMMLVRNPGGCMHIKAQSKLSFTYGFLKRCEYLALQGPRDLHYDTIVS